MRVLRQWFMTVVVTCTLVCPLGAAAQEQGRAEQVFTSWHALILELVRHTPTYTPPVASRSFAYLAITAFEATASGNVGLRSLAGQVNGLDPLSPRDPGLVYDETVVLQAAMAGAVHHFFSNTGPTGQRAMAAMEARLSEMAAAEIPTDVVAASIAYGQAVAQHIIDWSATDGGAVVINMGFPLEYPAADDLADWVPTSPIRQQQMPLLPDWGQNRSFAMPDGEACRLPPPPAYSEAPDSAFYAEALEVYDVTRVLTDEQKLIARFWSDDPMLSSTPPGHWIDIALGALESEAAPIDRQVDVMARLGIGVADGFIANWQAKYEYNLLRPVTYIRRVIDPAWTPLLITPPFPEYPSGHSTQSGAAATVLTALFGEGFAFEDDTHVDDGLPVRPYESFWQAAEEAGISRLYGGIHFRSAIALGLDQGRCVGAFTNTLITRE
jgi:hypothetical protein